MSMITNDWKDALSDEFKKDYYKKLYTFVKDEYSRCVVYPPADDIFNAFHFTPLKDVKVLILGQDPYHEVNQAHGLSFSVLPGNPIPKSLQNIYKELHDDCGCYYPNNGKRNFEMFLIELDIGAAYTCVGHSEKSEEYLTVLDGELLLEVNSDSYTLKSEDSICFSSSFEHTYTNTGPKLLKALIINLYAL